MEKMEQGFSMQAYGIGELVKFVYNLDKEQLVRSYSVEYYCKS